MHQLELMLTRFSQIVSSSLVHNHLQVERERIGYE